MPERVVTNNYTLAAAGVCWDLACKFGKISVVEFFRLVDWEVIHMQNTLVLQIYTYRKISYAVIFRTLYWGRQSIDPFCVFLFLSHGCPPKCHNVGIDQVQIDPRRDSIFDVINRVHNRTNSTGSHRSEDVTNPAVDVNFILYKHTRNALQVSDFRLAHAEVKRDQ